MSGPWAALQKDVREATLAGARPHRQDPLDLLDALRYVAFIACARRVRNAPLDHAAVAAQALERDAWLGSYLLLAMRLASPGGQR